MLLNAKELMNLKQRIINALGGEVKTVNAVNGNDFLRYGSRGKGTLPADWKEVQMDDADIYRGYPYAVIQKRANKVASLAKTNINTWVKPEVMDAYQKKGIDPVHPYLKLIEDSTDFSTKQFWKTICIYLDLAGAFYLGVVRDGKMSKDPNKPNIFGEIKKFILLNPYEIKRIVNNDGVLAGYTETKKDGRYREWPIHMIIPMRELNPFDANEVWSMTDASKEATYTLQQSGNYTRETLNGNLNAPGILTTDVILEDPQFEDFAARVRNHNKGEPIFGNGAGAITWTNMQQDLDRAALLDINEINRTTLFAVSGTSKTSLGIEQSGTTRETARVQTEQFISDTVQPRLEDILDFLNLDYKKYYKPEYDKMGYWLEIKSAVSRDYATETQATTMRQAQSALAFDLMQKGYTMQSSYDYAEGKIELSDLKLEKGLDKPQNPEQPEEPENPEGPEAPDAPAPEEPEGDSDNPEEEPPKGNQWIDEEDISEEENSLELARIEGLQPHGFLVENGGEGSGNFGHDGRPGEVGGSAPAGSNPTTSSESENVSSKIKKLEDFFDVFTSSRDYKGTGENKIIKEGATKGYLTLIDKAEAISKGEKLDDKNKSLLLHNIDRVMAGLNDKRKTATDAQRKVYDDAEQALRDIQDELVKEENSFLVENGGKGSGNYGHAGRPGKVGGSSLKGTTPSVKGTEFSTGNTYLDTVLDMDSKLDKVDITKPVTTEMSSEPRIGEDVSDWLKTGSDTTVYQGKQWIRIFESPSDAREYADAWNKRATALSKKSKKVNSLEEEHDHTDCDCGKVEVLINELGESDGETLKQSYQKFLDDIEEVQKETYRACIAKLTINAFDEDDIISKKRKQELTNKLRMIIQNYWWILTPLLANSVLDERNSEFAENVRFVFTNELQNKVENNAVRVSDGHMKTILDDVLEASNKAFTDIIEGKAAEFVVEAYKDNDKHVIDYFDKQPSMDEALRAIRNTDILEENRKIYERANNLALEGYKRSDIVKKIREEYEHLSEKRADLIAGNETARAYTHAQYEADYQFLNSIGQLETAYKRLVSRRPDSEKDKICPTCQALIDLGPIPFTQNFVSLGETITTEKDGKVYNYTCNYEDIESGVVHPRCMCHYELILNGKTLNEASPDGDDNDGGFDGGVDDNSFSGETRVNNGGKGSGNFGHSGRPGLVGGSAKNGENTFSSLLTRAGDSEKRMENASYLSTDEYKELVKKFDIDALSQDEMNLVEAYVDMPATGNSEQLNAYKKEGEWKLYRDGIELSKEETQEFMDLQNRKNEAVKQYTQDQTEENKAEAKRLYEEYSEASLGITGGKIWEAQKTMILPEDLSLLLNDDAYQKTDLGYTLSNKYIEGIDKPNKSFQDFQAIPDQELDEYISKVKDNWLKANFRGEKQRREIDALINEKGISLDKDIIVTRRVNERAANEMRESVETKGSYIQQGFTSTSASKNLSARTPGGMYLGDNIIRIVIPAGTKFLPIEAVEKKFGDEKAILNQHEILLPSKTNYISSSVPIRDYKDNPTQYQRGEVKYDYRNGEPSDMYIALTESR